MTDFEDLYRRHAHQVFRFALSLCGNRALAEDITSETFTRVWTARARLDLSTVTGYLLTIARNLHLQGRANDWRRDGLTAEPVDRGPDPHDRAAGRDDLSAVLADLQALPEPDRAALLMRATEQLPYDEIAAALGITTGSAKVKVHRARRTLAARRQQRGG